MPRRSDLNHASCDRVRPILIGQPAEFDYRAPRPAACCAEGLQVTPINLNPATIMTDPGVRHDHTYVEPITPAFVEKVIAQQAERGNKIDAVLATPGRADRAEHRRRAVRERCAGALRRRDDEPTSTPSSAARDRQKFKDIVAKVGGELARSRVCFTMDEVRARRSPTFGLPVVVRPSFTMGVFGSGMAYSAEDVERMAGDGPLPPVGECPDRGIDHTANSSSS